MSLIASTLLLYIKQSFLVLKDKKSKKNSCSEIQTAIFVQKHTSQTKNYILNVIVNEYHQQYKYL